MTAVAIRVRRVAASRGPRVAAALAAAALMASLTGAARQPAPLYPVQAAFASPGPYATTTGTVTDATSWQKESYSPTGVGNSMPSSS